MTTLAIFGNQLLMVRRDPLPLILAILLPGVVATFTQAAYGPAVSAQYGRPNGAEFVVPGMAALFAMTVVGYVGYQFFREHGDNTWDRLRVAPVSTWQIIAGKVAPGFLVVCIQQLVLLGWGMAAYGMTLRAPLEGLLAVVSATALVVVCFAVLLVSVCRSIAQVNGIANVGSMVMGGLGGALTPLWLLSPSLQRLSMVSPIHWTMRGYTTAFLQGGSSWDLLAASAVLFGWAALFATLALRRFRVAEPKQHSF